MKSMQSDVYGRNSHQVHTLLSSYMSPLIARRYWSMKTGTPWAAIGLATAILLSLWLAAKEAAGDDRWVSKVELIPLVAGPAGPESMAFDPDGEGPYTGISDGRILKWQGGGAGWLEYAAVFPPHLRKECIGAQDTKQEPVCGRPLGLGFNKKTRNLYVADAYLGLLEMNPDHKFPTPVAKPAEGTSFHFANSLDIDQDSGIIYFTVSSRRFQRRHYVSTIVTGDKTGRLMSYNPHSKEVQVLLSDLSFPNGVALSQDGSFLLIAETTTRRILKYWLRPPQNADTSRVEVLIQLPGFPDNVKLSPRGGFWVGIHSRRRMALKWLLAIPYVGETLARLPVDVTRVYEWFGRFGGQALALRVSDKGEVMEVLEDTGGKAVRCISEILEANGTLWFGSLVTPSLGVYKI